MELSFNIRVKIKEAWILYKKYFGIFLLLTLLTIFIQSFNQKESSSISLLIQVINILLSYVWIRSVLGLIDHNKFNPFSKEILPSLLQFWNYIKTTLLFFVLCFLPIIIAIFSFLVFILVNIRIVPGGIEYYYLLPLYFYPAICFFLIISLVPSFYLLGRLIFTRYLCVEKNQGAVKSIKESWDLTEGQGWYLFGKSFVIGLFVILGFVAFFVGSIITYPIGMILLVMLYRSFKKAKEIKVNNDKLDLITDLE